MAVAVIASLVATTCAGGGDTSSTDTGRTPDTSGAGTTTTTTATAPVTAPTTDTVGPPSTTLPADGIGLAETTAPDPAALVLDEVGRPVPGDQVLVLLDAGLGADTASAVAAAVDGEVVGQIEFIGLWQIRITPTDAAGLERAIEAAGSVEGVDVALSNGTDMLDEEIWGTPVSPLEDPVYAGETGDGYRLVGVETAWEYMRGSGLDPAPVHVGIVDTGVWLGTGEFDGGVTLDEQHAGSGVNTDPDDEVVIGPDGHPVVVGPDPVGGHGTGVATIIAADGADGGAAGIASVIPGLHVSTTDAWSGVYGTGFDQVPIDVRDDASVPWHTGVAWTTGKLQAIAEQVRSGARVINMSWGNSEATPAQARVYRLFFEQMATRHPDVLFVASAGNDGASLDGTRRYPSGLDLPNMITVGNVRNDGTRDPSSNTSSANFEVTLAAPGQQAVQGLAADGTIANEGGGTSMAAPHVTAAAALVLAANPDLTAAQVKALLVETARSSITADDGSEQPIGPGLGAGLLSIDGAVAAAVALGRERLGLEPAELDAEELGRLGTIDAVAVSGADDDWTVTAHVRSCLPPCTDVTIELQGSGAIAGSTTQHLDAAGTVAWNVVLPERPATIVVRRTDNDAASRILVDRILLDGRWTGSMSLDRSEGPGATLSEPWPVWARWDLGLTTDGTRVTAQVVAVLALDGSSETLTLTGRVDGAHVTLSGSDMTFEGSVTRRADDTLVIRGAWSSDADGWSSGGTWRITRSG